MALLPQSQLNDRFPPKMINVNDRYMDGSCRSLRPASASASESTASQVDGLGRSRSLWLRIGTHKFAPSCFHSASTGGANANAAPKGALQVTDNT